MIVENTNLYSCQERGDSIAISKIDIQNFIGIELLMGIVDLPAYTDHWSRELRYEKVACVMPLKKYQLIRRYIHFVDNTQQNDDRYFKIRPLLDIVKKNFLAIEEEKKYSVDEMMVPYKGTRAGSRRQYIKNKPHKWGFKIFVRAGVSGIIYAFLDYGGEDTFRQHSFSEAEDLLGLGGKVVVALCSTIVEKPCSFVYFDNFFTSLELLILLREKYGIFSMGTIRSNRLRGCPLDSDKELVKRGRGSYDRRVCNSNKICVVKWQDNKTVCLTSTFCEVEPIGTIKRIERKNEKQQGPRSKINIPCPDIVKNYNAFMGGVDLADMLVALYRTGLRSHRWYLAIFSQVLDMCVSNSWLVYRRDCKQAGVKKTEIAALKEFRCSIAESLIRKGRRYSAKETRAPVRTPTNAINKELRFDRVDHFPETCEKGRCKNCQKGQTRVKCIKCCARLCLTSERNCFFFFFCVS